MTLEKWKIIKRTIFNALIALIIGTLIFKPTPFELIAWLACFAILDPFIIKSKIKRLTKDKKNEWPRS